MIPTFEEYIKEGFIGKTLNRYRTGEQRKESGKKVMTELGSEIFLNNPDCDYKGLMEEILVDDESYVSYGNVNHYQSKNEIKKDRYYEDDSYIYYLLSDNITVAGFEKYDFFVESDIINPDEINEHDFKEILQGIVKTLNECDLARCKNNTYDSTTVLLLIDENKQYDYECEMNEADLEYYWQDFKEFFEETFTSEMKTWSYNNYGVNIGIPITYDSLKEYKKCKEFVIGYFEDMVNNKDVD